MKKNLFIWVLMLFAFTGSAQFTVINSKWNPNVDVVMLGMSTDGRYVTGYVGWETHTFIWDKQNPTLLNENDSTMKQSRGHAVSLDGTVVGKFKDGRYIYVDPIEGYDDSLYSAGIYDGEKWLSLGIKDSVAAAIDADAGSIAEAITPDGKLIAGARKAKPGEGLDYSSPTIWTVGEDTIIARELKFPERGQGGRLKCISDDGKVAGGFVAPYLMRLPTLWDEDGNYRTILYQGMALEGEVYSISPNGKYAALTLMNHAAFYDIENDELSILVDGGGVAFANVTGISNNRIVVGNAPSGAFIYSEKTGILPLADYLEDLGFTIPENFSFLSVDAISADGLSLSGRGYSVEGEEHQAAWHAQLSEHQLSGLHPARYLEAEEAELHKIKLSWDEPLADDDNTFVGYNLYRNGTKINTSLLSETIFLDSVTADGSYSYTVAAVWNSNEEARLCEEAKANTGAISIPFMDDFDSKGFDAYYWNPSLRLLGNWTVNTDNGINPPSMRYFVPLGSAYEESVVSAEIIPNGNSDLFLSYNIYVPSYSINHNGQLEKYGKDSLFIELYDGSQWHIIAQYTASSGFGSNGFNYKKHDLSTYDTGGKMRLRITARGDKGSLLFWLLDNIHLYNAANEFVEEMPIDVSVHEADDHNVHLNWANPTGFVKLSYLEDDFYTEGGIGNEGDEFIAANLFDKEDLKSFHGYKLSSISAFLTKHDNVSIPATYSWFAAQGDDRIVDEPLNEEYKERGWVHLQLSDPIEIDTSLPLYFGIEVLTHEQADLPVGMFPGILKTELNDDDEEVLRPVNSGRSNLTSEDGGLTWKNLENFDIDYSIGVKATLVKNENSVEQKELLGYAVFRDGKNMIEENSGEAGALTTINNFLDYSASRPANHCYDILAYYTTQKASAKTAKVCVDLKEISSIKDAAKASSIEVFPNPISQNEMLYIGGTTDFTKFSGATVRIYDLLGSCVKQQKINANPTTVKMDVAPGIYQIVIHGKNGLLEYAKVIVR